MPSKPPVAVDVYGTRTYGSMEGRGKYIEKDGSGGDMLSVK